MSQKGILMTPGNAEKCHRGTKTVTRRLILPQPPGGCTRITEEDGKWCFENVDDEYWFWAKPAYQVGDVVAIKETHWRYGCYGKNEKGNWRFAACGAVTVSVLFHVPENQLNPPLREHRAYHKRPAIFMPYDIARTYWEIVGVRAERLHDITDADVIAEGILGDSYLEEIGTTTRDPHSAAIYFMELWDSINAARGYPWANNDYVWRYEGERVTI